MRRHRASQNIINKSDLIPDSKCYYKVLVTWSKHPDTVKNKCLHRLCLSYRSRRTVSKISDASERQTRFGNLLNNQIPLNMVICVALIYGIKLHKFVCLLEQWDNYRK